MTYEPFICYYEPSTLRLNEQQQRKYPFLEFVFMSFVRLGYHNVSIALPQWKIRVKYLFVMPVTVTMQYISYALVHRYSRHSLGKKIIVIDKIVINPTILL